MITEHMSEKQFDFIGSSDKQFIIEFTKALEDLGYTYGGEIGSGFCWGKFMLIFRKANVKSKKSCSPHLYQGRFYCFENVF